VPPMGSVTIAFDSEFAQSAGDENSTSAKAVFSIQPPAVSRTLYSQRYDIDDPAFATAEADRSVTRNGEGYS
jgi:hypothetical protein